MTGPEHYAAAERLLATLGRDEIVQAQVHATLALAAATAYPAVKDYTGGEGSESRGWASVTA